MKSNSIPNKTVAGQPRNWAFITLVNLLIAALLGFILRYKMSYSLNLFNTSHLLHAHSHFVFHAWASLALMGCFTQFLLPKEKRQKRVYGWIFWSMLLLSFGILISFMIQGYGFYSILFSTLAQLIFYWFIVQFVLDGRKTIKNKTVKIFSFAALFTLFLSTLGPYFLAYFTANEAPVLWTRSSLYFYLHFQYNGWFSFAIFSLFFHWLDTKNLIYKTSYLKWTAILFILGVIPMFSLSLIGDIKDNFWITTNAYFAVSTKIIATLLLGISIFKIRKKLNHTLSKASKILWILAAIAFVLKTCMETLLLHPELATFAFAYRPLAIAYLHLIFLVMLSFFLLGYFFENKQLKYSNRKLENYSLWGFVIFVLLSEAFLFLQALFFFFVLQISLLILLNLFATLFIVLFLTLFTISQIKYPIVSNKGF